MPFEAGRREAQEPPPDRRAEPDAGPGGPAVLARAGASAQVRPAMSRGTCPSRPAARVGSHDPDRPSGSRLALWGSSVPSR